MASPTQTVVGKIIPNPLIAEGLLKIMMDLIPLSPPKSLTNSCLWNGKTTNCFPSEIITDKIFQVNIIPLTHSAIRLTLYP